MIRMRATVSGALALLFVAAIGAADERPAFVPANDNVRSIEIASEPTTYEIPNSDGSVELSVVSACNPQRSPYGDVTLGWDFLGNSAEEVRVDITGFNDGFTAGRYVTSGARSAARRALMFRDGEAGVYYYWRLLTRRGQGWVVRATGRFEAPTCPDDSVDESQS